MTRWASLLSVVLLPWFMSESSTVQAGPLHAEHYHGHAAAHVFRSPPSVHGHAAHWSWANPVPPSRTGTTVRYFIHNHGGANALSTAQMNRIRNAARVWTTAGANLRLVEVTADTLADIHVHGDSTSGCGSSGLGCAEFTFFGHVGTYADGHPQHRMVSNRQPGFAFDNTRQELTLLTRSDWYAGTFAANIGSNQFDYMSAAIHEFGHLMGLTHINVGGHPSSQVCNSPMNASLPRGTARRRLQLADVQALTHLYGPAPPTPVPEPSSLVLLGLGVIGVMGYRWRQRRTQ